jgi:hypothetical protein
MFGREVLILHSCGLLLSLYLCCWSGGLLVGLHVSHLIEGSHSVEVPVPLYRDVCVCHARVPAGRWHYWFSLYCCTCKLGYVRVCCGLLTFSVALCLPEFSSYCNGVVLGGVRVCPSLSLVVVCHVVLPLLWWECLEVSEFRCVMVWWSGSMWVSGGMRGTVLYLLYGLQNFVWDDCVVII